MKKPKRPNSAIDSTRKPDEKIWDSWTPTQQRAFILLYKEFSAVWPYPPLVKFERVARDQIANNLAVMAVSLLANYLQKD